MDPITQITNYIDGRWTEPCHGQKITNPNPGDLSDTVSIYSFSDSLDVKDACASAAAALQTWEAVGPVERGRILYRAADIIDAQRDAFATAITREHGKTTAESRAEVDRTIEIINFFAGEGRRIGGRTSPADDARTLALTTRVPIGVVGLITPWNFPLAIPAWKTAPALLAGCTTVLKPSPFTPVTASLLVHAVADAGVPPGVLNLVIGDAETGAAIVENDHVAGVSFTGSVDVGRRIHHAASRRFARTQLEMGGKNAAVVLRDADLGLAVDAIVNGAFGQAGQRCSATSRALVAREIHQPFLDRLLAAVGDLRVGPGTDPRSHMGPLISRQRLDHCLTAVVDAAAAGATVASGGRTYVPAGATRGFYMEPTVLTRVDPTSAIAREEVFGPVLSVIDIHPDDDVATMVNDVEYGMAATIFGTDISTCLQLAAQLRVGMVHINRPGTGAYPHMPHVGTKNSQHGPAECSTETFDFYTQVKSTCVAY